MDIIHLLPDTVANQIAAGEVVQRPASVIKELLENSIDAHATTVQIILKEAGRELIQVIDNGVGMSPADARMAFEKHATSKISHAADLFNLHTMGFRGEALASIAAVAEVELRTRCQDNETGVLIELAGSKLLRQEPCACPVGANFQVRNLFYNIPARRKFLKSNQTELSNIITEVQHVALAYPEVEITLIHNDQQQFSLPSGSFKQRIVQLFSKSLSQQLLPLSVETDLITISGFVCVPEGARKKGALQYFFVNDRFMKHPYFHKAVMECYQELIPEGSQPNYFICFKVDPHSIDVNIHPTKTEIKFENDSACWHILQATIREALGKFNALPSIDFDQADAPEIMPDFKKAVAEPKPQFSDYNPFKMNRPDHWESLYQDFSNESLSSRLDQSDGLASRMNHPISSGSADAPSFETIPSALGEFETMSSALGASEPKPNEKNGTGELFTTSTSPVATSKQSYLQVGDRYIVGKLKGGMLLIDQHRAHLCVLFDRYYTQIRSRQGFSQHELFPEIIEVPPADEPILQQILPELGYLGFELDNLGGGSYAINGKPASLENSVSIQELMHQMIETASDDVHGLGDELNKRLALRLAKSQAIPYGRTLGIEEVNQLVESLLELPDHQLTPDGHPVMTLVKNDVLATLL